MSHRDPKNHNINPNINPNNDDDDDSVMSLPPKLRIVPPAARSLIVPDDDPIDDPNDVYYANHQTIPDNVYLADAYDSLAAQASPSFHSVNSGQTYSPDYSSGDLNDDSNDIGNNSKEEVDAASHSSGDIDDNQPIERYKQHSCGAFINERVSDLYPDPDDEVWEDVSMGKIPITDDEKMNDNDDRKIDIGFDCVYIVENNPNYDPLAIGDVYIITACRWDAYHQCMMYECKIRSDTEYKPRWLPRKLINNDALIRRFYEHNQIESEIVHFQIRCKPRRKEFKLVKFTKRQYSILKNYYKRNFDYKISLSDID